MVPPTAAAPAATSEMIPMVFSGLEVVAAGALLSGVRLTRSAGGGGGYCGASVGGPFGEGPPVPYVDPWGLVAYPGGGGGPYGFDPGGAVAIGGWGP
jgi:hypothetical protein